MNWFGRTLALISADKIILAATFLLNVIVLKIFTPSIYIVKGVYKPFRLKNKKQNKKKNEKEKKGEWKKGKIV